MMIDLKHHISLTGSPTSSSYDPSYISPIEYQSENDVVVAVHFGDDDLADDQRTQLNYTDINDHSRRNVGYINPPGIGSDTY